MISGSTRFATEKAVFRPALWMSLLPGISEMQMTKSTYSDILKHPFWQRKRLEVLDAAGWKCENCDAKEKTLHVHHRQYVKGRKPWEYEASELEALCEDCHVEVHQYMDIIKTVLAEVPSYTWPMVASLLVAWRIGPDERFNEMLNEEQHAREIGYLAAAFIDLQTEDIGLVTQLFQITGPDVFQEEIKALLLKYKKPREAH